MKAFFTIAGFMAAAVMSLTNCQPTEIVPETLPESGTATITVTSDATRTANNGMSTVWSSGDALNIFCGVPNSTYRNFGKASIEEGAGTGRAVFSFNYEGGSDAVLNWYILYPYNSSSERPSKLVVDLGSQTVTQSGYDSKAHLAGSLCPLYGVVLNKTISEATIPVHQLSSVIEFNVNNNSGTSFKVKSVKLDATEEIVGRFNVDILEDTPAFTKTSASKTATVSISNPGTLANGSTAKAYLPVKPYKHNTSSNLSVTVTLDVDGKTVEVPFSLPVSSAKATFVAGRIKPVTLNVTSAMIFGSMNITSMTAKCHKATVVGEAAAVGTSKIQYRKSGASSWTPASSTTSASTVTAELTGLDDNTTYEVRVSAGSVYGTSKTFTTKKEGAQLYNMSFDDWYTKSNVQYCYSSSATSAQKAIWASANENTYSYTKANGAAGDSFVAVSGSGKQALKLTSQLVEVKVLGVTITSKFAAGSLFTGSLGNINISSMSATINMGVSFTDRPDALEGYACYKPQKIDYAESPYTSKKGSTDTGHVFVLLTDWSGPFAVTPPNTLIDFDGDSHIIGYGKLEFTGTDSSYKKFTLPITYRSDRTPKYVVICGASSALGDYFTGGKGSILYLDEFKFIYE